MRDSDCYHRLTRIPEDKLGVAVARKGDAPLTQIARDFGFSEGCLRRRLKQANIDDGTAPGASGRKE